MLAAVSNWYEISPEEQYRRLNSSYPEALASIFPAAVAGLVVQFTDYNLGENGTNWFTALSNLKRLPATIPPLPSNIHEILNTDCPFNPNQLVNDSHSLWLVPAGTVDELSASSSPLVIDTLRKAKRYASSEEFAQHEWILIAKKLLPGSERKTFAEQIRMIVDIRSKAFLPYEVPSFKYAVAPNLLNMAVKGQWLWGQMDDESTRVQDEVRYEHLSETEVDTMPLTVGSYSAGVLGVLRISAEDAETRLPELGMVALYRFPGPKPPKPSFCVLS